MDGGKWGAHHGLDVPLSFDNAGLVPGTVGDRPAAARLAGLMADAWIGFARRGSPNSAALPEWPAFDLTRRATMIFDETPSVVNDPRGVERRYFGQVPYVQPGT